MSAPLNTRRNGLSAWKGQPPLLVFTDEPDDRVRDLGAGADDLGLLTEPFYFNVHADGLSVSGDWCDGRVAPQP